jgi:hypothetical protein
MAVAARFVVVALAAAALVGAAALPAVATACKTVRTTIDTSLTGPTSTEGTIESGILKGTTAFSGAFTAAVEPTTLGYTGTLTITTDQGTLTISDVGVLDLANNAFAEIDRVTGGTGRFAGATGTLFVSGPFDPVAGSFEGAITGEVCLADESN